MNILPARNDALIVIDVQSDFLPGGSLAVPEGDAVIPEIELLARRFDRIILTQDWHPAQHKSFASAHPGRSPFETTLLSYGPQMLWPDHCVMGSPGAEIMLPEEIISRSEITIRKGCNPEVDSYSAFFENDRQTPTVLHDWLSRTPVGRLWFVGLALDYCVKYSALDARRLGYEAVIYARGCRGIDPEGSRAALAECKAAGINIL